MARLHRYRGLALLLSLSVESWAQTSPAVEPANSLGEAETAGQVQSEAAADVAMAQSAAVAMGNISGPGPVVPVPKAPQVVAVDDVNAVPVSPTTAAPAEQECKVLAGPVGKGMQVILFCLSVAVLLFKYRRESGDRTASEFFMDSSKQLVGAGWIHVLNILFAKGLEAHFEAGDQCHWYWLNIVLDCTLGVAVEYVLMLFLTSFIQKMSPAQADDFDTGDYKGKDGSCHAVKYVKQILLWLVIVSLMKICMCAIMAIGHNSLIGLAQALLSPFANDATLKLFVVMILTPVCMNAFQFWMVDNFIKRQGKGVDVSNDLELDGSMRTRIQHGDM